MKERIYLWQDPEEAQEAADSAVAPAEVALAEDLAAADSAVDHAVEASAEGTDPEALAHIITDTIITTDRIFITTYTSLSLASIAALITTTAASAASLA